MHIVYVSREYPPMKRMGGIAAYLKETAEAMARRGHRVTVICASDDTRCAQRGMVNGVDVIRLSGGDFIVGGVESNKFKYKKLRCIYRFRSYRRKVRDVISSLDDVDVVEVGEYGAEAYYLSNLGIPVIIRLHTPTLLNRDTAGKQPFQLRNFHEYWIGKKELTVLKRFENITSCSTALKNWTEHFVPSTVGKIDVIYNPIDVSMWKYDEGQRYENNTVFYAGTVSEVKGVGNLVEACRILRGRGVDVRLKIAGKLGAYGCTLKQKIDEEGSDWCEFLGHVSRDTLVPLYRQSKVCCFPSWWENLPMVCLEAMSIGNVVIGSSNGGMAEIIIDNVDGYLVEPKSAIRLADTIEKALKMSKIEVDHISENARNSIRERFSTEVVVAQLETYYKTVINKQKCEYCG